MVITTIARVSTILLALTGMVAAASFEVTVTGVTATQAVLTYTAPDDNACSIVVKETGQTTLVHDVNPVLFAGANSDTRAGSAASGRSRTVVVGKRAAELASDGKFYSRALQTYTSHDFSVTCGEETVSGQFATANIALGNTYPELPGFSQGGYGNYAWPTLDWIDRSKTYIDPLTGILLKRVTGPGDFGTVERNQKFAAVHDPLGSWSNASNVISGSASSLATTTSTDPLFVAAGTISIDYTNAAGYGTYSWGIDDILEKAYGSGTDQADENRTFNICLTADSGQSCASGILTITAPQGTANAITTPGGFPAAPFQRWGGKPIDRSLIAASSGKVDVSGMTVTLRNSGPEYWFNLAWRPGSKIYIQNSDPTCPSNLCTIMEVLHSNQLSIAESLSLTDVDYRAANFGLLVAKNTNVGSLSLSFAFDVAASRIYNTGGNGSGDFCSRNIDTTSVDANGNALSTPLQGYLCIMPATTGWSSLYFFIPSTGETRLLSRFGQQYNGDPLDGIGSGSLVVTTSSFDPTDPRVFYAATNTGWGPYFKTVWKGRYGGDYRALGANYANTAADGITWTNLTLASQGKDIGAQFKAARSDYDPSILNYLTAAGLLNNYFIVSAGSSQDGPCMVGFIDIRTGLLAGVKDSWSDPTGRWGVCHSIQANGGGDWMLAAINAARYQNSGAGLAGPFYLTIAQVYKSGAWSDDTSFDENFAEECPADITQQWKDLGATGNNCVRIRVSGEPCSSTPTAAEKTKFPCPYDVNKSMLQTMAEGDLITDFSEAGGGTERLRIVKKVVNGVTDIELTMQRKALCTNGAPVALFRHANGWHASMTQPGGCHGAGWWLNMSGNPSGWIVEDPEVTSSHNDVGTSPTQGKYTTLKGSYASRFDQEVPAQFGKPLGNRINGWPTFAGSTAVIEGNGTIETYPSVRQWNAPAGEKYWALDFRAYQAGLGVMGETPLGLFNNNPQMVSGMTRVYKINNPKAGFDRKRLPYIAWAGRHWLRDMSGPGSTITDADLYSYCIADKAGECQIGSIANDVYVNVPKATIDSSQPYCATNVYGRNYPCFATASPVGAWAVQWDVSKADETGRFFRRLTMGLSGPGRQYTFANAKATPDGKWAFIPGYWLEGYRMDVLAAKLPPWPGTDTVARNTFINVDRTLNQVPDAPKARVRFGYAENGAPEEFFCSTRREACVAAGSPYSFLSEAPTGQDCSAGCSVSIPAIPGRVLYYQVERLASDGTVVSAEPIQAVAIP
jgi:hypothetical protein